MPPRAGVEDRGPAGEVGKHGNAALSARQQRAVVHARPDLSKQKPTPRRSGGERGEHVLRRRYGPTQRIG